MLLTLLMTNRVLEIGFSGTYRIYVTFNNGLNLWLNELHQVENKANASNLLHNLWHYLFDDFSKFHCMLFHFIRMHCIFDQLYIFNNWQKMEKNLVIQPISTMTSKRKSPGFSNRTPHYLLHSSLPSGKWWWCFENKDSQQTGHQMVYTASTIYYILTNGLSIILCWFILSS